METGLRARILLVDDDASLNRTLALVLAHKGYAVAAAKGWPGPRMGLGPSTRGWWPS